MINEIEALVGIAILILLNYLYIYQKSRIIGSFVLLFCVLMMIPIFNQTNYEGITIMGFGMAFTAIIINFASKRLGKSQS